MYIIRKMFKFEMAHQLASAYSSVCKDTIHGHSYTLELFFAAKDINQHGMVLDFGEVSDKVKKYIDTWDHALVIPECFPERYLSVLRLFNKKLHITPYNPTAENMARMMFSAIKSLFPQLVKVRLHETSTGYAEYSE